MTIDRRTYLRSVAAVGATAATAGCMGVLGGDANPDVVLGKPDLKEGLTLDQYRGHRYPVWGERIPDVTVPAALSGGEVAVREVSKPSLFTFFYSHCNDFCPRLVSGLVNLQGHAVENGYVDEVAFLPITFDPTRDDPNTLRQYAEDMGVRDAGTWRFLRPATPERANEVVWKEFGVTFGRPEEDKGKSENYDFLHPGVIMLVNGDAYVERVYELGPSGPPPVPRMIDDLRTVRNA